MKTVILDIGNVVVRWDPHALYGPLLGSREAVEAFFAEVGFQTWNLEQDRGRDWDEAVTLLSSEYPHRADLIALYRDRLMDAHPDLVPGMDALTADLRKVGVPLVALSNASLRTATQLAARYPAVFERFSEVVVSAEHGLLKPDAEIYHACLTRCGLKVDACIFVDDSRTNVDGARAVGMDAIHFMGAEPLRAELHARGVLR
jgi:2-haloacid dehalogenase